MMSMEVLANNGESKLADHFNVFIFCFIEWSSWSKCEERSCGTDGGLRFRKDENSGKTFHETCAVETKCGKW